MVRQVRMIKYSGRIKTEAGRKRDGDREREQALFRFILLLFVFIFILREAARMLLFCMPWLSVAGCCCHYCGCCWTICLASIFAYEFPLLFCLCAPCICVRFHFWWHFSVVAVFINEKKICVALFAGSDVPTISCMASHVVHNNTRQQYNGTVCYVHTTIFFYFRKSKCNKTNLYFVQYTRHSVHVAQWIWLQQTNDSNWNEANRVQ